MIRRCLTGTCHVVLYQPTIRTYDVAAGSHTDHINQACPSCGKIGEKK